MNPFQEMLRKTTSTVHYRKMLRFASPLRDFLGINHFWYYKITVSGYYSYLGTHEAWNEFSYDRSMVKHFPCLRHPDSLQKGINLMKASQDEEYNKVLDIAWEKFEINFALNLVSSISDGVEAFGFATKFNDDHADERLLNNLPVLREFTRIFKSTNEKLLQIAEDNSIDISMQFGQKFYERPKTLIIPFDKNKFLSKIGFEEILSLAPREKDILKFISAGYPSTYIAKQLHLSKKTVENYLSNIKCKLSCKSKIELIKKAQEIASTGYFDDTQ